MEHLLIHILPCSTNLLHKITFYVHISDLRTIHSGHVIAFAIHVSEKNKYTYYSLSHENLQADTNTCIKICHEGKNL